MIMIISNLQLNWGSAIQNLYSVQNTLSGNIFKIVSLDCLLGSILNEFGTLIQYFFLSDSIDFPTFYLHPVINIAMPFVIMVIFNKSYVFIG